MTGVVGATNNSLIAFFAQAWVIKWLLNCTTIADAELLTLFVRKIRNKSWDGCSFRYCSTFIVGTNVQHPEKVGTS